MMEATRIQAGTILTCRCGAEFEVKQPCTCEQKQDMICGCGMRLEIRR